MSGRLLLPGRSTRRRAAAIGAAALLWSGLAPAAWQTALAEDGRTDGVRAADARASQPGTGLAWGSNASGQLGDGTTTVRSTTPVRVCGGAPCPSPFDDVIAVDGSIAHSVALRADGTVWAWGSNASGQLGNGTNADSNTPVQVCAVGATAPCADFLTGVTAVSTGFAHVLALRADGSVVAWGNNGSGQLGDGTNNPSNVPVVVSGLTGVAAVSAGDFHSLAAQTSGTVKSWGDNTSGQLGNGTNAPSNTPVPVTIAGNVTAVAGGGAHSLALRNDGVVQSWGANLSGQLGNGTNTNSNVPVQVSGLTGVKSIAAGVGHSLAVPADGIARTWGNNGSGQLGNGTTTNSNVPVRVCAPGTTAPCASFLTGVKDLSGGFVHSASLHTDGTVRTWGGNSAGQLGNGTTTNSTVPVRVCEIGQTAPCTRFLDGVGALGTGDNHTLAVQRPSADLAIAIKGVPNPVPHDQNLTYTLTVKNNGPTAAEDVRLDDTLPADGEFVSAVSTHGSCVVPPTGSTDTVTCALGDLAANTSKAAQIVITVRANAGTTVVNTAKVTSGTPDPNQINNTATVRTRVS
ncbi:hypothetical protein ACFY8W_29630 [Streptomyces sp. NPDC012637]|uniref:RCC1 domain-containing protein n=1 Tax=Streptomyces sp. NPDC012637 TaxID=3364842 RepID=UPI0036E51C69